MTKLMVWPDGTYCEACDYTEADYGCFGDDYLTVDLKALHWPGKVTEGADEAQLHQLRRDNQTLRQRVEQLAAAVRHLGGCDGCGKPYFHHLNEPFASCECATSEWHEPDTVIMKLQERIAVLEQENLTKGEVL